MKLRKFNCVRAGTEAAALLRARFSLMVRVLGGVEIVGVASTVEQSPAAVRKTEPEIRRPTTCLAKGGSSMKSPKLEKQTRIWVGHAQLAKRMPRKWN